MLFETEREHNLANVHKQEFDLKKAMNALVVGVRGMVYFMLNGSHRASWEEWRHV